MPRTPRHPFPALAALLCCILFSPLRLKGEQHSLRPDTLQTQGVAVGEPDVLERILSNSGGADHVGASAWDNPALAPWRHAFSESHVAGGVESLRESRAVTAGKGEGHRGWGLGADAYIHSGKATLWGDAGYQNGRILNPQWNESGAYDRIYPYLIADTVGGDLKTERYSFHGGYAQASGPLCWGVEGGYVAVLSYRDVDPRPKNTSGDATVRAGIGLNAWRDYIGAISLAYNRYRISTDITFASEMGESKLFHLTGLGTHYTRFDGAGSSVYNDINAFSGTLNLLPASGRGAFLNASGKLSWMRHVIVDINRLPMAGLNGKEGSLQGGYKSVGRGGDPLEWGAWGEWHASRRHGREHIFGDPTSGSYPQIGSLDMYADNAYGGSLSGFLQWVAPRWRVSLLPEVGWEHRRMVYLLPRREWLDEHLEASLDVCGVLLTGPSSLIRLHLGATLRSPLSLCLDLPALGSDASAEDKALDAVVRSDFEGATSRTATLGASTSYDLRISRSLAAGLRLAVEHTRRASRLHATRVTATLSLTF